MPLCECLQAYSWSRELAIFSSDYGSCVEVLTALGGVGALIWGVASACSTFQKEHQDNLRRSSSCLEEALRVQKESRQELRQDLRDFRQEMREELKELRQGLTDIRQARPRWGLGG